MILSRERFASVRTGNKNILVQISTTSPRGDLIIASTHSRELLKYGWKGSGKSIPAAYLTGLLTGLKAVKKGVKRAILYAGMKPFVHGSRMGAAVKGMIDAGLSVSADKDALPSEERLKGLHIAKYAEELLQKDEGKYRSRFSALLHRGFDPKDYPTHFEEIKSKILKMVKKSE